MPFSSYNGEIGSFLAMKSRREKDLIRLQSKIQNTPLAGIAKQTVFQAMNISTSSECKELQKNQCKG